MIDLLQLVGLLSFTALMAIGFVASLVGIISDVKGRKLPIANCLSLMAFFAVIGFYCLVISLS